MGLTTSSQSASTSSLTTTAVTSATTALASDSVLSRRGVSGRRFAGLVVYNDSNANRTVSVRVTDGTISNNRKLDQFLVEVGDSKVMNEEDYGIDLADDEYITVQLDDAVGSGQVNVFSKSKDLG